MNNSVDSGDNLSFLESASDDIYIGRQFSSYAELCEFLQRYESINRQKFYKKRSRTINAVKKNLQRELKPSLEFYELEYECVHGKERGKRGNGYRQTSTLRLGCNAYFKLRVCTTGKYLKIYSASLNHTKHDSSKNVFEHRYRNRESNVTKLQKVQEYLPSLDANNKTENKTALDADKKITLKDLHNIHYKTKIGKNNLGEVIHLLKTEYQCNVYIVCDDESNFKALQFTTESMRNAMSTWPEFVTVDRRYKLAVIGCTLYLCLVEDSNGEAEIVCVSLVFVEDDDIYHQIFNTFKNEMSCDKIKCFMGVKDLVERDVIKELFPGKPAYINLYHTLNTFRREIHCDKLKILKDERDLSLEYLKKLVYSKDQSEYDALYVSFKECVPESVSTYFDKNWHSCRNEWLACNMTPYNLGNTSNKMESINHKIKQVVSKNGTLIDFINNFFIFLDDHKNERASRAANNIFKKSLYEFGKHRDDMELYSDFLTKYSFNYIQKQINALEDVKIVNEDNEICEVINAKGKLSVTTENCECNDFSSMMLPCKHILAVRERKGISLFAENLCHVRWTKAYYLSKEKVGIDNSDTVENPVCATRNHQKILTLTEKRKAATQITNSLANLLSLASNSDFVVKLEILKKIEHCWRNGKEISVVPVHEEGINNKTSDSIYFGNTNVSNNCIIPPVKDAYVTCMNKDTNSSHVPDVSPDEMSHIKNESDPTWEKNMVVNVNPIELFLDENIDDEDETTVSDDENSLTYNETNTAVATTLSDDDTRSVVSSPALRKRRWLKGQDTKTNSEDMKDVGSKNKRKKIDQ